MPHFEDQEVLDYIAQQECAHWNWLPEAGVDRVWLAAKAPSSAAVTATPDSKVSSVILAAR